MDIITPERRSWNMSRIKGKNTKPEIIVRSLLFKLGYRFRLHYKKLPGKPDIVIPKYKTIIFVHGCFWHRHTGCQYAYSPKSRVDFWENKFNENINRDKKKKKELEDLGWKVIVLWECETKNTNILQEKISKIINLSFM